MSSAQHKPFCLSLNVLTILMLCFDIRCWRRNKDCSANTWWASVSTTQPAQSSHQTLILPPMKLAFLKFSPRNWRFHSRSRHGTSMKWNKLLSMGLMCIQGETCVDPFHAKLLWETKICMCSLYRSLEIELTQIVEIHQSWRQEWTELTYSISCLLMTWWRKESCHHQVDSCPGSSKSFSC